MTTFGRLATLAPDSAPTNAELNMTRSIELTGTEVIVRDPTGGNVTRPGPMDTYSVRNIIIDRSLPTGGSVRGLSLSDPDGGYTIAGGSDVETDGIRLTDGLFPPVNQARDTPYDADLGTMGYHDVDDIDAIWTNGVMKTQRSSGLTGEYKFRVLHLQRLADPDSAYDVDSNPYVTVDIANVDLLAFNGLTDNPSNGNSTENGLAIPMDAASSITPFNGETQMGGIERGEKIADDNDRVTARRVLFRIAVEEMRDFRCDPKRTFGPARRAKTARIRAKHGKDSD
jgi:hypothetical protein